MTAPDHDVPSPADLRPAAPTPEAASTAAPGADEANPVDTTGSGADLPWGRVAEDGTVYVRTGEGERAVGSYPEGSAEEAMAFFTKRYDALAFEVELLEKRIHAGALSPEEARGSIDKVRTQVVDANAVGDLQSLTARLDGLAPVLAQHAAARREERAARATESRTRKEAIVATAETLAGGTDWRNGANRLRDLLEEWKALPRIDRPTDDALWKRFSAARTTYTRARKAHFSEVGEQRSSAKQIKQRLVAEAEELATSTEWGPTAGRYRDLMSQWKAAGSAQKSDDDALWRRFRAAQDAFFGARDAAAAETEAEFEANASVKEAILVEAEQLLPVGDLDEAKRRLRELGERWEAAGKVPRARIKELEGRMRKVEQAVRHAEDAQWRRTDPEKSARAGGLVAQLEDAVAKLASDLAKAQVAGDTKKAASLEKDLAGRQSLLDMARKAAADFS